MLSLSDRFVLIPSFRDLRHRRMHRNNGGGAPKERLNHERRVVSVLLDEAHLLGVGHVEDGALRVLDGIWGECMSDERSATIGFRFKAGLEFESDSTPSKVNQIKHRKHIGGSTVH